MGKGTGKCRESATGRRQRQGGGREGQAAGVLLMYVSPPMLALL